MNTTIKEKITGAWHLLSFEQQNFEGKLTYPLGKQAKGSIYYLPDGHVSVHIMDVNRSEIVDETLYINKQLRYSELGYLAYSGRYHIDEEKQVMTHHVEISMYPEWVGGQQVRLIKLDGDHLQLSSMGPSGPENISFRLLWKRD
jgi:hypothetical protein